MSNIYFVGLPKGKRLHKQIFCQDITDPYNKSLEMIQDKDQLAEFIYNKFSQFRPCAIVFDAKNAQEAADSMIKRWADESHLQLVK